MVIVAGGRSNKNVFASGGGVIDVGGVGMV